jgi:hypothetical protein
MPVESAPLPVRKQAGAYGKQRRARRTDLSGFATGVRAELGRSLLIMNAPPRRGSSSPQPSSCRERFGSEPIDPTHDLGERSPKHRHLD